MLEEDVQDTQQRNAMGLDGSMDSETDGGDALPAMRRLRNENANLRQRLRQAEDQTRAAKVDLAIFKLLPDYKVPAASAPVVRALVLFPKDDSPPMDPGAPDFSEQLHVRITEALVRHPNLGREGGTFRAPDLAEYRQPPDPDAYQLLKKGRYPRR